MRLTKKTKLERYDALELERDALARYVWHLANSHTADAIERYVDTDGGEYAYHLYGALDADGGTVVCTYRYTGQSVSVVCQRLDVWALSVKALPFGDGFTEVKAACERLIYARAALWRSSLNNL